MMGTNESYKNYFGSLVGNAKKVLGCSMENIKDMFAANQTNLFNYSQKTKEQLMEIRVEGATLTCFLSEKGTCDSSFLFLDNLQNIEQYIAYCNEKYPSKSNNWLLEDCLLSVQHKGGDSIFQFMKQ